MKYKKIAVFIVFFIIVLILSSTDVLAYRYVSPTEIIVTSIIDGSKTILMISYIVFFIIYMINSKKKISDKVKILIKWGIIVSIVILVLRGVEWCLIKYFVYGFRFFV